MTPSRLRLLTGQNDVTDGQQLNIQFDKPTAAEALVNFIIPLSPHPERMSGLPAICDDADFGFMGFSSQHGVHIRTSRPSMLCKCSSYVKMSG